MEIILVINSGSSTLKFSLFSIDKGVVKKEYQGIVDRAFYEPTASIKSISTGKKEGEKINVAGDKSTYYQQSIEYILNWISSHKFNVVAAGHRVVHGGSDYFAPVILDDDVVCKLSRLSPVMPLHQPFNLKGVEVLRKRLPKVLQVACFDTAFHSTCNPISQHYALPKKITDAGVRRYGFHGLSYEYVALELAKIMPPKEAQGKFVVAHLGGGATMCAIHKQKSVATSIGFTGIGGLPMGTRCDSIDPGAVLYIMDKYSLDTKQMYDLLYKESGLLGVSGVSADMRDLLLSNKKEAKLAIDIFVHRVSIHAGSLAAELQGLDGFIFTGGIGENAAPIREMIGQNLMWFGAKIDHEKNHQQIISPTKISAESSRVAIWVVPSDEDSMIAKHAFEIYQDHPGKN